MTHRKLLRWFGPGALFWLVFQGVSLYQAARGVGWAALRSGGLTGWLVAGLVLCLIGSALFRLLGERYGGSAVALLLLLPTFGYLVLQAAIPGLPFPTVGTLSLLLVVQESMELYVARLAGGWIVWLVCYDALLLLVLGLLRLTSAPARRVARGGTP